jgi:hypothetical protein
MYYRYVKAWSERMLLFGRPFSKKLFSNKTETSSSVRRSSPFFHFKFVHVSKLQSGEGWLWEKFSGQILITFETVNSFRDYIVCRKNYYKHKSNTSCECRDFTVPGTLGGNRVDIRSLNNISRLMWSLCVPLTLRYLSIDNKKCGFYFVVIVTSNVCLIILS